MQLSLYLRETEVYKKAIFSTGYKNILKVDN